MAYLKKLVKSLLWSFGLIFILTIIITLFSYINIFNDKTISIMKIIVPIISIFIGSLIIGKSSKKKGWLEGLKIGLIYIVIFIILSLILKGKMELKNILYYIILIISSMFGSMVGINKK